VLTHFHQDHIGAAAAIAGWAGVEVMAHHADEAGFGDGAVAVAVPGHTPGSVALYLPRHQVLFTGDTVARTPDGRVICGVFNVDRAQAAASLRRLAALDTAIACFGHGEPLTSNAAAALRSCGPITG